MPYSELFCLSNYSFLKSASHPDELVIQADQLGYDAIAITDECSLAGVVKAHVAAKDCDIKLIIGSHFNIQYESTYFTLVILAPSRDAYAQLSALITLSRRKSEKGTYTTTFTDIQIGLKECVALWHINSEADLNQHIAYQLKNAFPKGLWLSISHTKQSQFQRFYKSVLCFANQYQLRVCAVGCVTMHHPDRQALYDVMSAIRLGRSVDQLGFDAAKNRERSLRPLMAITRSYPKALISESNYIADLCSFSLDEIKYNYPNEVVPERYTPSEWLRILTDEGIRARWPEGAKPSVVKQINYELDLINELNYEHYFLTVHDIVQFARDRGILCQGRGSAANSAVCYCLFITEVDPAQSNLLFERFISKERNEPPDIDIDFEHHRREEVIQYIYKKYGRNRAALAATVVTYRPKSAIRDVGKAIGLDNIVVEKIAKSLAWWDRSGDLDSRLAEANLSLKSPITRHYAQLIKEILGMPRHLSQHVGGFIITQAHISSLVPIENAAMPDRTIIQWDKEDIEALGLLKIDILALGMLSAIQKSITAINQYTKAPLTIDAIPSDCPKTYNMLCSGDSVGVFQVESRAQMNMLPRLQPRNFYDLVIEVAIVRPGPIQGDMVHPYLRRRQGLEAVEYPSSDVKEILERTLGVPIFQEQVIKLAMVAAGFSGGEADQLRRAMASWQKNGRLHEFKEPVIQGMLERGHNLDFAERLFRQIQGFGEYGFPEAHAASFALLVYISAWLKCHYPAAFYCGLLNSQPMGFYTPSQLLQDAIQHGVECLSIDINQSHYDYQLEFPKTSDIEESSPSLRLGFRQIKGIHRESIEALINERHKGAFKDASDLIQRCRLPSDQSEKLIASGAFLALGQQRFQSHWDLQGVNEAILSKNNADHTPVNLRSSSIWEDVATNIASTGVNLLDHPLKLLQSHTIIKQCTSAEDSHMLSHGRWVQVAGIVTCRQRPGTSSGIVFLTLEDHTGNHNIVVTKPVQDRCRKALLSGRLLHIKGIIERADPPKLSPDSISTAVIHVKAGHIADLSSLLPTEHRSRDFH